MQLPELVEGRSEVVGSHGRFFPAWKKVCAGVLFAAAFSCIAQDGRPGAPSGTIAGAKAGGDAGAVKERAGAADSHRKKQISDESTQLLAMAVALKAEVDKSNKDVLSMNVIRKADEIERLAHTVKIRIKQGPS
jgi:hypothetical protein